MIKSILDTDAYKLTMSQAYAQLFPEVISKFTFFDRDDIEFPKNFWLKLRANINEMSLIRLEPEEYQFLKKSMPYLNNYYLDFLKGFRFDPNEVTVVQNGDNKLKVYIAGYTYRTTLWEVPLLSMISELYFQETGQSIYSENDRKKNNVDKWYKLSNANCKFAEFGTRRRYSFDVQKEVVENFSNLSMYHLDINYVGTSNVYLSMLNNTKPIGTMAHEWFMFHSALYGYKQANKLALENWNRIYKGNLGIALPDTFTTDVFLNQFTLNYAKMFDGLRQDSGDPIEFGNKVIEYYKNHNINPLSKTIIFSDSLNTDKAIEINKKFNGFIKSSFGIGTHFSNDVGVKPLNIVIKMTEVDNYGKCVKLSDSSGKYTGDEGEIKLCKSILNIK